jgi:hypothetical protein
VGDQVDAALADPARVLARAHTVRSSKRPLGMRAPSRALADGEELLCTHVYDDTDLYHAQLKVRAACTAASNAHRARRAHRL